MDVLRGMGFAQSVCSAALAASDGDVDSALSLLLEHGVVVRVAADEGAPPAARKKTKLAAKRQRVGTPR